MNVLLATLNAKYIHSSLALRYLAASCRSVCPDIMISEYSINNKLLDVLGDIYAQQPAIVGLACYIWNIDLTLSLARLIKQVMPDTVIVLGGPEVSYDPGYLLDTYPCVDYVIQGEGEETLAQLIAAMAAGDIVDSINGLAARGTDGKPIVDEPQVVTELDTIPFPYSQADLAALKGKIIYYESSRGCPFSCQYCLSSATNGVRFFSLERVFQDLQTFIAAGVQQVKFVDRTFNANKNHYLPILRFLAAQNCSTNFHLEVAADCLDEEALVVLEQAPVGRFQLEIGIQSTHEQTLTAIQRRNIWPRLTENIQRLQTADNMHLHLDLIVGLPCENYERFGVSFDDVYRLRPHMLQIGFLKMLKGSGIRRQAVAHGYVFTDYAPYEVLQNNYLSYHDVRRLQLLEEVFNQTYNSGRFEQTLAWLVEKSDHSPFRLYEKITDYWECHDYHRMAHSAKSVSKYLLDFCREKYKTETDFCAELLKFDALTSDGGRVRPDYLPWQHDTWQHEYNRFWGNAAIVLRYICGYSFTTWREVKRLYQIEVFSTAVVSRVANSAMTGADKIAVLFDYSGSAVKWTVIANGDFFGEDQDKNAL